LPVHQSEKNLLKIIIIIIIIFIKKKSPACATCPKHTWECPMGGKTDHRADWEKAFCCSPLLLPCMNKPWANIMFLGELNR
jgi:hypothetical protein